MRVVFMGTPEFAVPSLEGLASAFEVCAVVSQPDRPRGRGLKLRPTPVKARALDLGLQVLQPLRVREAGFLEELSALAPDVILVAAYSRLLPPAILELPRLGCVNLHPSLLPRYRGAIPIQAALINGDSQTGLTTFLMDEGYDTGDLLMQVSVPIDPEETGQELSTRLAREGARVLVETVRGLQAGNLVRRPQPSGGDYTRPLRKEDLLLDWGLPASRVRDFLRALAHEPAALTFWRDHPVKLGRAEVRPDLQGPPGTVLHLEKGKGPVVATGQGAVLLRELKPAGKGWMDGWAFVQGRDLRPEERFGSD
ncbi:MAG: methionyl-tRNA formyltransferase [Candidatus Xenobium sp.]|jgi:methionyl-tRNA formyltransferase|nr:methionyl-tRNA formyltransferase [Burkholderiales bacterium]